MRNWRPLLTWTLLLLGCALVFAAYLDPHLVQDLGSRVWGCF